MSIPKTKPEQQLIQLHKINPNQLVEFSKWEEIQKKIVTDNPFIEITDTATYNEAKSNRTALLKGRTSLLGNNGQEGTIRNAFKNLLTGSITILKGLADITETPYEKQQEEVKRYEALIEERRLEKQRKAEEERMLELKRIKDINDKIYAIEIKQIGIIKSMEFKDIELVEKMNTSLRNETNTEEFQEFEVTFYASMERIDAEFADKELALTNEENQRLEQLRFAEEKKQFEEQQLKAKEAQDKIDAENEQKQLELDKKEAEIQEGKRKLYEMELNAERKRVEEKEKKDKIIADKKAEVLAKKQAKEEEKRLKELQPDLVKAQSIVDSLQFESIDSIKSKEIKSLIADFAADVAELINTYTTTLKTFK